MLTPVPNGEAMIPGQPVKQQYKYRTQGKYGDMPSQGKKKTKKQKRPRIFMNSNFINACDGKSTSLFTKKEATKK